MGLDLVKELSRFMDKKGLIELELDEEGFKVKIRKVPISLRKALHPEERPLETKEEEPERPKIFCFTSTMVGTFHLRPEQGAPPYLKIGDEVKIGDILCHIKAMGIKNEIRSNINGKIMELLVEDGHPVEYGQGLFLILPYEERLDV